VLQTHRGDEDLLFQASDLIGFLQFAYFAGEWYFHNPKRGQEESPNSLIFLDPHDLIWKEPICYLRLTTRELFGPKAKEAKPRRKPHPARKKAPRPE
jgi:hypothetical protein